MRIFLLERMERDGREYPTSGFYEVSSDLGNELVDAGKAYHSTPDNVAVPPEIADLPAPVADEPADGYESEAP